MSAETEWQAALATYHAASKAGAQICNAAYVAARAAYEREMATISRDDIADWAKVERRYDLRCQEADAAYAALVKLAHEELLRSRESEAAQ